MILAKDRQLTDIAALTALIEPEVNSLGFDLVRVAMIGGTSDPTLQVMAEAPATRQLTIDDCGRISRRLSEKLDALEAEGLDPIEGGFRLEVSSPGIDRPLTRPGDFVDWTGHEARLKLAQPVAGRMHFSGTLDGIDPAGPVVRLIGKDGTRYLLPFEQISSAKLLLTDRLITATAPLSTEGAEIFKTKG